MKARKIAGGYLVRLDRGEEAVEKLTSFAVAQKIPCGVLQGIGAVNNLELGYFDTRTGKYRRRRIRKTVEVVNLTGNISYLNKKPFIHAHITVADSDQKLLGGHLFQATVAVTLEICIKVINQRLNRIHDPKIGFNFWDL
jgi:predicted DNA-binding protein with PD1-like motif